MNEVSNLVRCIVSSIVDDVDKIKITEAKEEDGSVLFEVIVSKNDVGKLIGKDGRIAIAIRTIVKASGAKHGVKALFNVLDKPLEEE